MSQLTYPRPKYPHGCKAWKKKQRQRIHSKNQIFPDRPDRLLLDPELLCRTELQRLLKDFRCLLRPTTVAACTFFFFFFFYVKRGVVILRRKSRPGQWQTHSPVPALGWCATTSKCPKILLLHDGRYTKNIDTVSSMSLTSVFHRKANGYVQCSWCRGGFQTEMTSV